MTAEKWNGICERWQSAELDALRYRKLKRWMQDYSADALPDPERESG